MQLILENSTLKTWIALEEEVYDGWVLRYANGYTGRSNSAIALHSSSLDVHEKIDYCEQWYQQRGINPRFRMIPDAHPPELDSVLEKRGYEQENVSWVMLLDMVEFKPLDNIAPEVQLHGEFREEWVQAFCRLNAAQSKHQETMCKLLPMIRLPTCYASLTLEDEIVAVALLVRDGDYAGVFDVVTREDMRGQGLGKTLIGSLLTQALRDEVRFVYLQMMASNTPAYRLYTRFGFREAYPYWYRSLTRQL